MSRSSTKSPGKVPDTAHPTDENKRQGGATLGLAAFEKISAVDGIKLTARMRRDVCAACRDDLSESERTRYLIDRYGKR